MTHAQVINGQIHMMESGRMEPVNELHALAEYAWLSSSPFPSSQERARQVLAAYRQVQDDRF